MELSTSDTAVPSREDKTHVPEASAATLLHDGSTQGVDAAVGQTFVVSEPARTSNGQGTAGAESQTLIAPDGAVPNDNGGDYRFGATVVADAGTPADGFEIGATVVGDEAAVQATRRADVVSSFDAAQQAGDLEIEPRDSLIAGKFRVIKTLGEGSFGAVYLAEDPKLDRRVAIKITKVGVLTTRSDVDRFQREARAAAQLRHPNIVPVYDTGSIGRSSYLVYEYIEGQTLGSHLKAQKRLDPRDAAQVMLAISGALGYAHELGIIHRDMKPDNVLLDKQGQPHIADFGLARRDSGEMDKTREGGLMGTPLYMSPEQASGRSHEADARADVWSLGVMLREMLTGVLPFQGKLTEILIAIQTVEPPKIRSIDKKLPKDLETICQKCLSKDAALRYANGTELAAELDRYLRGEPILARPLSTAARIVRWARRNPKGAAVMALLLCAAVVSTWAVIAVNQERTRRALDRLDSLTSAQAGSVQNDILDLKSDREIVAAPLRQNLAAGKLTPLARNRLQLARITLFPEEAARDVSFAEIAEALVTLPGEEVAMQVKLLDPYREQVVPELRIIANDKQQLLASRTALFALAFLDPASDEWDTKAADAAAGLLAVNARDLSSILGLVAPIRDRLRPELERQFRGTKFGVTAASVLAELYREQPEALLALAYEATPEQLSPLINAMSSRKDEIAKLARGELSQNAAGTTLSPGELRPRTNAFLVLYAVAPEAVQWDVLSGGVDHSLRTEIIHALPQAVPHWQPAADRLRHESDALVRQALLLILAEYPVTELQPEDREALRKVAIDLYRSDPSPAVHAAAHWFIQQSGGIDELRQIAAEPLESTNRGDRDWFRNRHGQEFVVVNGPVEFQMGAHPDDKEQNFDGRERQHLRRIPRSFAVGMREVTVAEFKAYKAEHYYDEQISPKADCPITEITWIDAAKYCRWLSEQEGVPEDQMCFPPADQIEAQTPLPENLLDRTGYRLPTAAEWEYTCRAGTITSRPFGQADRIQDFARYDANSNGRTWPVGSRQPNGLGTFDMLGNVWEWCQDWYFDKYLLDASGQLIVDGADTREGFEREARGGSYADGIEQVRTTDRDNVLPDEKIYYFGFRLARTIRGEQ